MIERMNEQLARCIHVICIVIFSANLYTGCSSSEGGKPQTSQNSLSLNANSSKDAGNIELKSDLDWNQLFEKTPADGDTEVITNLFGQGVDPNTIDTQGLTPLIVASKKGRVDLVIVLLGRGADPGLVPAGKNAPIIEAVLAGHEKVVRELIKHGVDINVKSDFGHDPLRIATYRSHIKIVEILRMERRRLGIEPI